MISRKLAALGAVALVAVSACGQEEHPPSHQAGGAQQAKPQQAFLQAMVPHHESAIDMARVAEREGESSFVKALARTISRAQQEEIVEVRAIHQRLYGSPLRPEDGAHAALGLSAQEAGMHHMDAGAMLRGKRPFDRAFVDEMIPHHEGAIAMARAVLRATGDPEVGALAQRIIRDQRREITEMNAFRERGYRGAAPKEATPPAHGEHGG
jgi:uncharacterized protein (DUF305 family)